MFATRRDTARAMSEENVEVVRELFSAMARRDSEVARFEPHDFVDRAAALETVGRTRWPIS